MKQFRLGTFIALVMLFCLGLHKGHAQTSPTTTSYTAVVSTPSGPSDPPAGPSFLYFGSTATLKPVGQPGELTAGNIRYKWTAKMKQWQSGSGFTASNAPTDFLDASSPPDNTDTSTQNPTILRTVLATSGYYQLTLSVTITYDMVDSNGNGQTNLTANGSATCQIEVAVPDFSMSGGTSITVPLDSSAPITLSASSINNFIGNVTFSLTAGNPNPGQPANPSGVTLGSGASDPSLEFLLNNCSNSTTTTINVAGNATPTAGGSTPFIVYGDGSDNGPSIEHSTSFNLTIPKRYAEITCLPYDTNTNITGQSAQRNPTNGSLSVDAAAVWTIDPSGQFTGWHGRGSMKTQNEQGFASVKSYAWSPVYGGQSGVNPGITSGINVSSFLLDDYLTTSLQSGLALTKQSTINLTITNSPGSLPYTTSYVVNWHYPYENWVRQPGPPQPGGGTSVTYDNSSYEVYTASAYVASGLPVNVTDNIPTSNVSDSLNIIIGGVVGTTGAGIGTVTGADLVGLSNPVTGAAVTLLAAASLTVTAIPVNARGICTFPTTEDNFLDSILIQKTLIAHPGTMNYINHAGQQWPILDPNAQRINPISLTGNIITTNPTNPLDANYYANIWAGVSPLGKLSVSVMPGRYRAVGTFIGDHYDQTGYKGKVTTIVKYPASYDVVYQWQIGQPAPGPKIQ